MIQGIIFKKLLLVADLLEGLLVFALSDLSFLKILTFPQLTLPSSSITKCVHPT